MADIDVTDPALFEEYTREVPATETRYGGRYLGRGGLTKVLEGDWHRIRLVILEFPDMNSLIAWYESPEYAPLKAIRERSATSTIVALEGVASH
ncbi:DUF1330 domain-containing protein [Paraburkholderia rhizosphaerae]|uniref:DUF1330 domain-containing protein n=1 Tax=Paraburkholderia rhizosphaerae TaxID=480658 RepID=UPI002444112E|nr:DUF1330 domain-containing protein [Paraburkholderia rhizosphaerae]